MRFPTLVSSPHLKPPTSVGGVMREVLYALVPGVLALVWLFGFGVIWNIIIAAATAYACEAAMLATRKRPVRMFLADCSALVTAVLLGIALPPLAPWWLTVVGTAFAMVFGKHLYGGLGYNPFNPAMLGYVVLLISFPQHMTQWAAPASLVADPLGPLQSLQVILTGVLPPGHSLDALTAATPLDAVKTGLGMAKTLPEIRSGAIWGALGGKGWVWVNVAFLGGGLYLVARRIIGWPIPAGVLTGLAVPAAVYWSADPSTHPGALFQLVSGAAMIGAFFIATDPVSAATTPRGRLYYGLGIGFITWLIRSFAGYPDGIAFAVLLMNMAAPLIDSYTRPRVYGQSRGGRDD